MTSRPPLSYPWLCAALGVAVALATILSLMIGPAAAGLGALFGKLTGGDVDTAVLIMREVRLPRALLAILVGGSLGLSGAALQGFLRNPLAEPGVIGISGAASLGAVIALYFGLSSAFAFSLPLLAIVFALGAAFLLHVLAGRQQIVTLILAGVALSSLSGALTALALNFSPNPFAAYEIVFWMLGSISDRSMVHVGLAGPFVAAGWVLLLASAPSLDALSLGEETAASMGTNLARTRTLVIGGTALAVGAATAVSGVIGFVGLVIPHLLRPLVGHRPSRLLPASALGGALTLLVADILVRVVTPGTELKLGVVTALVGAPFFLWLVLNSRKATS